MRLSEILLTLGFSACGVVRDEEIVAVSEDSRESGSGTLFVAILGERLDGHGFIKDAYLRGVRSFAVTREISGYDDCNMIFVENAEKFLAETAYLLNGNPERELRIIGITGTKGKSTVAAALFHIFISLGVGAAALGTFGTLGLDGTSYRNSGAVSNTCLENTRLNGSKCEGENTVSSVDLSPKKSKAIPPPKTDTEEKNQVGKSPLGSLNTTPTPPRIARAMRAAREAGCEYFILEVSSQALSRGRILTLPISAAIFTNIGLDHIGEGEHSDFSDYLGAKRKLFTDFGVRLAVVNSADPYSEYIASGVGNTVRVGREKSDVPLSRIISGIDGTSFYLEGNFCNTRLVGDFNADNLSLAAVCAARLLGRELAEVLSTLRDFSPVGRFELIPRLDRLFVIDYAHNGMSVRAVLSECKRLTTGRVIAVFGSVGGRSRARRRELAEAVSSLADFSVITADNPNFESAEAICSEIAAHMPKGAEYIIEPSRKRAIKAAFRLSLAGDVIALLGKGHENYQLILGERVPFSERDILFDLGE